MDWAGFLVIVGWVVFAVWLGKTLPWHVTKYVWGVINVLSCLYCWHLTVPSTLVLLTVLSAQLMIWGAGSLILWELRLGHDEL